MDVNAPLTTLPPTCQLTAGPGPLEIKSPQICVNIDHFAGEIEPGYQVRFECVWIYFTGLNSTYSNLGLLERAGLIYLD